MGQQHRLRPLQVRVPGQVHVVRLARPLGEHLLERHDLLGQADERAPAPQAQRRRDLVVAAPSGVQLRAGVPCDLGDPPLDSRVDVLVARAEGEPPLDELLFDDVERIDERVHLAIAEDPRLAQPLDVRARPGEVVERQRLVEREAHRELRHGVRHPGRDPPLPQGHVPAPLYKSDECAAGSEPVPPSAPGPWRDDHVATPRPHSRTKPSASWWRKVSDAS